MIVLGVSVDGQCKKNKSTNKKLYIAARYNFLQQRLPCFGWQNQPPLKLGFVTVFALGKNRAGRTTSGSHRRSMSVPAIGKKYEKNI
jgi:hypothetical protein